MTDAVTDSSSPLSVVATAVTAVTLYGDHAQVTRSGKLSLTGEEHTLLVSDLPSILDPDSMRVKGSGSTPVKILGIQTDRIFNPKPVADQAAQLTEKIDALEQERQALETHIAALDLQRAFVQGLIEKSVERFSRGLAEQRVGLEQTRDLLRFGGEQYQAYAILLIQKQQERRQLQEQIQSLKHHLHQLITPLHRQLYRLLIDIAPAGSGDFKVEVSYTVAEASWTPHYDLRVNPKAKRVTLRYLANVRQRSGEPWQDVRLSLSTAQPGLGSLPPQLRPWYLDAFLPPPTLDDRVEAWGAAAEEKSPDPVETAMAPTLTSTPAPNIKAETVAATAAQEGGVVYFDLSYLNTVPNDGEPHQVTIFETELPCELTYLIVPKQVTFAYLQATITNPIEGVALLPGQAHIFREEMFVGSTEVEYVAPGQTFQVALGIDEGIRVERDLVERSVDKKPMRGLRQITYSYRIQVTQLRDTQAQVTVREQLPISRHERIKVKLVKTEPQITLGEMGLLEWAFPLSLNVKHTLLYQFTIEHPPEMQVSGLTL